MQGLLSLFVESSAVQKGFAEFVGDAIAFIEALKLEQADVLGFSLGGFVAQEVALLKPDLVRKLVLAGTPDAWSTESPLRDRRVYRLRCWALRIGLSVEKLDGRIAILGTLKRMEAMIARELERHLGQTKD